jgi:hypothetical protein
VTAPRNSRTEIVRRWLPVVMAGVLLGVIKAESVADPNVLWGIRDGREIIASGHLPHRDHWSWTVSGKDWVPNSWGWDVVLGALHRMGGGGALAALNIALVMVLLSVIAHRGYQLGASTLAVVAAMTVVGGAVLLPWINDRPQLISYVIVVIVVPAVRYALLASRRRFFIMLAGLAGFQILWVNLHFFAIIGPLLIAVAGAGHLLDQARQPGAVRVAVRDQTARLIAGVVVAVAACGVTPYGPVVAAKTIAVRNDAAGLIVEWRPAGFGTFSQFTGVLAIVFAAVGCVGAYRARRWDAAAAIAVLAVGTGVVCRMAPVTAVIAIPEVAAALSPALIRPRIRRLVFGLAAAGVLVGVGLAATGSSAFGKLNPASTSPALLARLPHGCRVLNDYRLGGALILFRPDVRVSVDSRTDLYGRDRILANRDLVSGKPGTLQRIDTAGVTCVLVPSNSGIIADLARTPGWHVAATDVRRTLLLKG